MKEFPLTARYLGEAFSREHEERGAGGRSFLAFVNERHAGGLIVDRAARDLARYESELARLRAAPALRAPEEPMPADDVKLVLSPDIAFLMFGADLPGMLAALREGRRATPRPRRGWILLVPRGNGRVDERELHREDEGWLLEWFREPTRFSGISEMVDERAPVEALWKEGLLARAP